MPNQPNSSNNQPNSPNNSDELKQIIGLFLKLLNSPLIFTIAARHPIVSNLLTGLLFYLSGFGVIQIINLQNTQNIDSNYLTRICNSSSYKNEIQNELEISDRMVGFQNWQPTNKVFNGREHFFDCNYNIKKSNNNNLQTKKLTVRMSSVSQNEEILNLQPICKLFEDKVKESIEIERLEKEEKQGNIRITDIFTEKNKNISTNKQQLLSNCSYKAEDKNGNSFDKSVKLEVTPLFTESSNNTNFNEEKIDLTKVCKHRTIKEQMKKIAIETNQFNDGDEIIPGEISYKDNLKDVYPAFRWLCSYSIKKPNTSGQTSDYIIIPGRVKIGLDLDIYCKERAKSRETRREKPTHKNYKDPYSLYCVNPHSKISSNN